MNYFRKWVATTLSWLAGCSVPYFIAALTVGLVMSFKNHDEKTLLEFLTIHYVYVFYTLFFSFPVYLCILIPLGISLKKESPLWFPKKCLYYGAGSGFGVIIIFVLVTGWFNLMTMEDWQSASPLVALAAFMGFTTCLCAWKNKNHFYESPRILLEKNLMIEVIKRDKLQILGLFLIAVTGSIIFGFFIKTDLPNFFNSEIPAWIIFTLGSGISWLLFIPLTAIVSNIPLGKLILPAFRTMGIGEVILMAGIFYMKYHHNINSYALGNVILASNMGMLLSLIIQLKKQNFHWWNITTLWMVVQNGLFMVLVGWMTDWKGINL